MHRFESRSPVLLVVHNPCGRVDVTALDALWTEVELAALSTGAQALVDSARVEALETAEGQEVRVELPTKPKVRKGHAAVGVTVRCPSGSQVEVRTASADVAIRGDVAVLEAKTASGQVSLEAVRGPASISTASGDVFAGSVGGSFSASTASGEAYAELVGGDATLRSASGPLRLGRVKGRLTVKSASGSVSVDVAEAGVEVETVSGSQRVGCMASGQGRFRAISGDVAVGVARGSAVAVDASSLSGTCTSEIPLGEHPSEGGSETTDALEGASQASLQLFLHTVSGDIHVLRAEARSSPASGDAAG